MYLGTKYKNCARSFKAKSRKLWAYAGGLGMLVRSQLRQAFRFLRAAQSLLRLGLLAAIGTGSLWAAEAPIYLAPAKSVDLRVEDLLQRMTLEEKLGQMNLDWASAPVDLEGAILSDRVTDAGAADTSVERYTQANTWYNHQPSNYYRKYIFGETGPLFPFGYPTHRIGLVEG